MAIDDKIKALTKQLYPTGRVWRINPNSVKEKFVNGLLASEIRAYNDAVSILDSVLPDNPNFTVDDASAWEKRLGLPDGTGVPLDQRMDAIKVQLNWPGTNPAKGAADYIQDVLQAAGYNVCVHENLFPTAATDYPLLSPSSWTDYVGSWTSKNATQFNSIEAGGSGHKKSYQPCVVPNTKSISLSFSLGVVSAIVVQATAYLTDDSGVITSYSPLTIVGAGTITGVLTSGSDATTRLAIDLLYAGAHNCSITLLTPIGTILSSVGTGGFTHKTYAEFAGTGLVRHKTALLHGQQRHGYLSQKGVIVANSVDPNVDDNFDIGDGSDTIFIGGCPPGTFINIPKSQETAFRQFILKIKPVNITVLLLVNFV